MAHQALSKAKPSLSSPTPLEERESVDCTLVLESVLVDDVLMFFALEVNLLFANSFLPESEERVS